MTLPNEIDQDVVCPDCGEAFAILDDGAGRCENGNCVSAHEWRSRKHVAALRNQRTPGHTEIPTSELEALREAFSRHKHSLSLSIVSSVLVNLLDTDLRAVDAILAHIPAKVDTVARLREIRDRLWNQGSARLHGASRQADADQAALEAAIEAMEKP